MSATYLTTAIVLDKQPWGERDAKVCLYSLDKGKLDLTVRGAMSLESKLNPHLENFNSVEIMVITGRNGDYVGSAMGRKIRANLKQNLDNLLIAGKFIAGVKNILKPDFADKQIYDLIEDFLDTLNTSKISAQFFSLAADIKLQNLLGFAADPNACQFCFSKLPSGAWQRPSGEFVCDRCAKLIKEEMIWLKPEIIKSLNLIYKLPFEKLAPLAEVVDLVELAKTKQRLSFYQ